MKRRIIFSLISLILAVAMMITTLSSCSADNSSLILCNVKLDLEENTRSFDAIKFSNDVPSLDESKLYYTATYEGTGASYGEATNQLYSDGILLSQGLWTIDCKWVTEVTNDDNSVEEVVVAKGSTGPIWVNLNTTSFVVHIGGSSGIGSALLSYKVFCSDGSVKNATCNIALSKWGTSSKEEDIQRDFDLQNSTSSDNFIVQNLEIGDLDSGKYLLIITINDADDLSLLFTDVIGFIVKSDCVTTINGKCYVKKGTTGNNEYIYWEDDPTNLDTKQDNVIEVGGYKDNTTNSDGNLSTTKIENKHVYIVNSNNTSGDLNLGHSSGNKSNRIITPKPANDSAVVDFGINMNGTDVEVTTSDKWYEASKENTTIIELQKNVTMTLYNYKSPSRDATWGLVEDYLGTGYTRRYECNTTLSGGSLNIVGPYENVNSISNGKITFKGPIASDNVADSFNGFYKQGAINIVTQKADTSTGTKQSLGGNVTLDGSVTLIAVTGISSWITDGETSSINSRLETNITIKNGAAINVTGDNNDTAEGIYIKGNNQNGIINIVLDKGSISTSGSSGTEAGIRIEKFTGTINIELKNESTINSTNGYGIYLVDCTGDVTIKKDGSSTISGKNTSSTIYTSNVPKLSKNF